jgi:arogenate dehydrogenase (NADP+)
MARRIVGVIGLGQFGKFWAKVLKNDHEVLVSDHRDVSALAEELSVRALSLPELCAEAEVIFLCVPINRIELVVRTIKPLLKPGTLVLDTCSVKVYPAQILEKHLAPVNQIELIATHPMFGPQSGAHGIFGLSIMMCPLKVSKEHYQEWYTYFQGLGLNIAEMSPEEHDRHAAYSQGVTHYIGRVLGQMDLRETPIDTRGYKTLRAVVRDTCNDTWELFHDLQSFNPYTKEMRLRLEAALDYTYGQLLPTNASPTELVIGIQGGMGSFNEDACRHYCATRDIEGYRINYLYTALGVLSALHRGEIDRGVVAIQNARGGVVMETIKAMSQYNCEILEIFDIVISHCILYHPAVSFDAIDTIISHPQALAQCESTLKQKYPQLKQISEEGDLIDQALCAQYIAEDKLPPNVAVLAPAVCADLFGLTIYDTNLQDLGDANRMTFMWVQRWQYVHS